MYHLLFDVMYFCDLIHIPGVYLSHNDDIIRNHGYVDISDIGSTDDTALICHTNRPVFENYFQSNSGGDWFGPDGTAVGTRHDNVHAVPGVRRNRGPGVVRLIRYTTNISPSLNGMTFTPPEGIYHCEVEDATMTQQTFYVGLYNSGGGMYMYVNMYICGIQVHCTCTCMCIHVDILPLLFYSGVSVSVTLAVDSDLNGASPQFTLTCISTGGPATTVTWTRDSEMLTGSTVLNDTETAQYTHTLTVTGRLGGLYTCTVANDKPSEDSAQLNVQGLHAFSIDYPVPLL